MIEKYKHFSERLKERYNISISETEYNDLNSKFTTKNYFKYYYRLSGNRKFGSIIIKEKEVFVIYDKELKRFVTCYFFKTFPLPKELKNLLTIDEFNEYIENKLLLVDIIFEWYKVNNFDNQKLFKEKPFNENHRTYSCVYYKYKNNKSCEDKIICNIVNGLYEEMHLTKFKSFFKIKLKRILNPEPK